MNLQIDFTEEQSVIRLTGELDLYGAVPARNFLIDHLQKGNGLDLDLSGVTTCDTAGLQLLLSAQSTVASQGKLFAIRSNSPAIQECARVLGISFATTPPENPTP
jgi:anti-anti-sigma factor